MVEMGPGRPLRGSSAVCLAALGMLLLAAPRAGAQVPPTPEEIAGYLGLHAAAAAGDAIEIDRLAKAGGDVNARDRFGRTPLMVAAFRRDTAAARALIGAGADVNLLENDSYDAITIAAALGNAQIVRLALAAGGYARAVTGPYGGSALIAAAQLGHLEAVELLIAAKASLDHVDQLGRTALIGAITLGNGDGRYQSIVEALAK